MICGNTQAEIDRDTATDAQEQAIFGAQYNYWVVVRNTLLIGGEIDGHTLAERLKDEYQEFADMVDDDIDFMAEYEEGGLTPALRATIEKEAKIYASVIVG